MKICLLVIMRRMIKEELQHYKVLQLQLSGIESYENIVCQKESVNNNKYSFYFTRIFKLVLHVKNPGFKMIYYENDNGVIIDRRTLCLSRNLVPKSSKSCSFQIRSQCLKYLKWIFTPPNMSFQNAVNTKAKRHRSV